jgi:DNA repair exonuclease SbcCD ATPase subunit
MPDSFALEQAVSCLTRVRQACDDRDELARAFADLAHAATVRLAQHARCAASPSQASPPMLLFGGTFQCHPLRNPYRSATDPQHVAQAEASLFARALDVWNASVSGMQDTAQLAQATAAVAEQLTTDVMQMTEQTRMKCRAAEDALAQLAQITIRQRELESRQAEAEKATAAARSKVAAVQAEIAALEIEFAASTEETQRLSGQLADFRSRVGPIDELRSECAALGEQVERGERELAELQQKRNDALRQRHEVERKLNDTRAMMQQVEAELDASVVQRIRQSWEQLPPDVFDERMRSG